jgi:hypothetical protein
MATEPRSSARKSFDALLRRLIDFLAFLRQMRECRADSVPISFPKALHLKQSSKLTDSAKFTIFKWLLTLIKHYQIVPIQCID